MILNALIKACSQLDDPRFTRVLIKGAVLAALLLIVASIGLIQGANWLVGGEIWLPLIGTVTWVDNVITWALLPLSLLLSVVLMVPVASAMTSLFLDDVATAVEARHYPELGPARAIGIAEGLRDSLGFLGVMISANLLAILLYLAFMPLAPLIFWGLNGFLLGREYFTMAAMRRVGRVGASALRRRHMLRIWAAGILMSVPLSIPLLNILVPVIGAALFTHLFHKLYKS